MKPVSKPRTTCPDGSPHHYVIETVTDGGIAAGACIRCTYTRTFNPIDTFGSSHPEKFTARQRKVLEGLTQ